MLPDRVTAAALTDELEAAHEWARRERLQLKAVLPQGWFAPYSLVKVPTNSSSCKDSSKGTRSYLPYGNGAIPIGRMEETGNLAPEAAPTPYGSSIFLDNGRHAIICTPFNRLAFSACDGPHGDWGELSHWMSAGRGYVYAVTIADMLDVVARDFRYTTNRMG